MFAIHRAVRACASHGDTSKSQSSSAPLLEAESLTSPVLRSATASQATQITTGPVGAAVRPVFAQVNVRCEPGEVVVLLGNNGAGKSTLLKMLAGLLPPQHTHNSNGKVRVKGQNLYGENALSNAQRARQVAYLPQQLVRPEGVLVRSFVSLAGAHDRFANRRTEPSKDEWAFYHACLEVFDAAHLAWREIASLSGGEWMRVSLARLWAQHTPLLLLDEPNTGLDLCHLALLARQIRAKAHSQGCALLLATHDLGFALAVATRVCVLDAGSLAHDVPVQQATEGQLLEKLYGVPLAWWSPASAPAAENPPGAHAIPRVVPLL